MIRSRIDREPISIINQAQRNAFESIENTDFTWSRPQAIIDPMVLTAHS